MAGSNNNELLVDELEQGAGDLADGWENLRARRLSGEDFRSLSDRITEFLSFAKYGADDLHKKLSEVLMAQDGIIAKSVQQGCWTRKRPRA